MDLFDDAVGAGTATAEDFGLTPYVIPTMQQVAVLTGQNGLKVVGSFSGCGGSSLGLRMAGFEVPYAIEFIPAAADTYRANSPGTFVDERDVRKIVPENILSRLGIKAGELDVFEGSPPCAPFSSAGSGEKDWGRVKKYSDSRQRTDDLFEEWIRLLGGLQPRAFIAENVPGMLTGTALATYTHVITRKLSALGYRVQASVLNATHYGVPQERRRLLFVGLRRDVVTELEREWQDDPGGKSPEPPGLAWPPPVETAVPHTVRQALAMIDPADRDHKPFLTESSMEGKAVGRTWHKLVEDPAALASGGSQACARCGERLGAHTVPVTHVTGAVIKKPGKPDEPVTEERYVSIAEAEHHVREGGTSKGITSSGKIKAARCEDGEEAVIIKDYFMLVVPEMDKPFPTVTATGAQVGAASVTHPTECRKLTPAEAKAACSFPQDFILTGTREQRYERMGRAVPPLMMRAVGRVVAQVLGAKPS